LAQPCPSCGAELSTGARFCGACGGAVAVAARAATTVTAPGGALSGERKQVSVLFADVVGSMVLAERLSRCGR